MRRSKNNTTDLLEYQPDNDEKKIENLMHKYADWEKKLNSIINTDMFIISDDPFKRQSLKKLFTYLRFNPLKKYPPMSCMLVSSNPDADFDNIVAYYENMAYLMLQDYNQYLIKNNIMQPFEKITSCETTYIDMLPTYQKRCQDDYKNHTIETRCVSLDVIFSNGCMILFCPAFQDMTIRINRACYMNIHTESIDEKNSSFELKISLYRGTKKDWSLDSITNMLFSFEPNGDTFSCKYVDKQTISHDKLMATYIKDMHWSKQQIELWFDYMNIDYPANRAIIELRSRTNNDEPTMAVIRNLTDARLFFNTIKLPINIVVKGDQFFEHLNKFIASEIFETYIRTIATINIMLFTEPRTDISENKYAFNSMVINSTQSPVIPSKNHIIKLQKG